MTADYRSLSLWHDTYPGLLEPRLPLAADTQVDIAIVGGGYTGLWTAYYLLRLDPSLRIVVIEKEIVGFGASGRNGGWCVGELAAGPDRHEQIADNDAARRFLAELFDSVDEVGRVTKREGIDCHFAKGGTIRLARNTAQLTRQREEVEHHQRRFGLTDDDLRLLGADEARSHLDATDVLGALFFAHTAALHPVRLVRGLGESVERLGATIAEQTTATAVEPGRVVTDRGTVRADVVVRALEGYTASLDDHGRTLSPLYSLMVATEPLNDDLVGIWATQIGPRPLPSIRFPGVGQSGFVPFATGELVIPPSPLGTNFIIGHTGESSPIPSVAKVYINQDAHVDVAPIVGNALIIVVVPEPASFLMIALGCGSLLRRRRKART